MAKIRNYHTIPTAFKWRTAFRAAVFDTASQHLRIVHGTFNTYRLIRLNLHSCLLLH